MIRVRTEMPRISPSDMPRIRAALCRYSVGASLSETEQVVNDSLPVEIRAETSEFLGYVTTVVDEAVESGELFLVSPDMCRLVKSAALTLPSFHTEPFDVIAESGLVMFDGVIAEIDPRQTFSTTAVIGAVWKVDPHAEIISIGYIGGSAADPHMIAAGFMPLGVNKLLEKTDEDLAIIHEAGYVQANAILKTTWLLMQQKIAQVSTAELDRPTRRRMKRSGVKEPLVRLITLRTASGDTNPSTNQQQRDYVHRWIVRGHWRQQWFPKYQVHRPVWIAPHLKGPEGAPLIGGEKVHAWRR